MMQRNKIQEQLWKHFLCCNVIKYMNNCGNFLMMQRNKMHEQLWKLSSCCNVIKYMEQLWKLSYDATAT